MTIGIYKLAFTGTNAVYIGQSLNVELRHTQHIGLLRKGKAAPKLQKAYDTYGTPAMEIILTCSILEIDLAEKEAVEIYDSLDNGFNMVPGGSTPCFSGTDNAQSDYTKEQYYNVLVLLGKVPGVPYLEISRITGVSKYVVSHISSLESHGWLSEVHPEEYAKIVHIRNTTGRMLASMQGVNLPPIRSPEGKIYTVEHITNFAKEHGMLQGKLTMVLQGTRNSHKGWTLASHVPRDNYPSVISPEGQVYSIPYKSSAAFAREQGLCNANLHSLFVGRAKTSKGWRLATEEEVASSIEKINLRNKAETSIIVS